MNKRHTQSIVEKRMRPRAPFVYSIGALLLLLTQLCIPIFPVFVYANEIEATSESPDEGAISEIIDSGISHDGIDEPTSDSIQEEEPHVEFDSTVVETPAEETPDATEGSMTDVITEETQPIEHSTSSHSGHIDAANVHSTTSDHDTGSTTTQANANATSSNYGAHDEFEYSEEHQIDTQATATPTEGAPEDTVTPANEASGIEDTVAEDSPVQEIEALSSTTASTTPLEHVVAQEEYHRAIPDTKYSFSAEDCARVADGSFYCKKNEDQPRVYNDRIFSGPDVDGDSEIFLEKDGIVTQITHNIVDDASPYYDARSHTLVWHRLVDARYQIVSLDLETQEEKQLTFDSYNNMQPSRNGDTVVWQGWVGNDWEIMLKDDAGIRMITDNTTHDIGPSINGDFIIWQAEKEGGWDVRLYNIRTGFTESVDGTNGASIENPRLVLMYDAKHVNGDIETRGYDFETGSSVSLGAVAPTLPEDIPEPEQTGEERALITPTTQLKTKTDNEEADPEGDGLLNLKETHDTGTSTATSTDIIVPPYEDISDHSTNTPRDIAGDPELTLDSTEDVITELLEESPSDFGESIPDMVITPYEVTVASSSHSQDRIAEIE